MKSSQCICISSQIILIKAPSFAESPPNFKETEWSVICQKVHGLETAVTAKFLVQSLLFIASLKNFVVRLFSGWTCATEYPLINWFSRLVSRDLQIPPWPMRLLTSPLCMCLWEGYQLNNYLLQLIVLRYSDEQFQIEFDDFLNCLIRLENASREYLLPLEFLALWKKNKMFHFQLLLSMLHNIWDQVCTWLTERSCV